MDNIKAYMSLGGDFYIGIIDILYGINDKAVIYDNITNKKRSVKIHYETEMPYIKTYGKRYRLNEFMRV